MGIDNNEVSVVGLVARLVAVENQPHDVAGMPLVEFLLPGRPDDVVRGRNDVGQAADLRNVVPPTAERVNVSHFWLMVYG